MRRCMSVALAVVLFSAPGCIMFVPWPNKDDSRGMKVAKVAAAGALVALPVVALVGSR